MDCSTACSGPAACAILQWHHSPHPLPEQVPNSKSVAWGFRLLRLRKRFAHRLRLHRSKEAGTVATHSPSLLSRYLTEPARLSDGIRQVARKRLLGGGIQ